MKRSIAKQAAALLTAGVMVAAFSPALALADGTAGEGDNDSQGIEIADESEGTSLDDIFSAYDNLAEDEDGMVLGSCDSTAPFSFKQCGKKLVVRMEENATTGYQWSCKVKGSAVKLDKKHSCYIAPKKSKNMSGVPGKHKYVFKTVTAGSKATIKFTYAQSWNPKSKEVHTVKVKTTKAGKIRVAYCK